MHVIETNHSRVYEYQGPREAGEVIRLMSPAVQLAPLPCLSLSFANVEPPRNLNPEPHLINPDANHSFPSEIDREVEERGKSFNGDRIVLWE